MAKGIAPATGPAVWTGVELSQNDDWIIKLTPSDLKELNTAVMNIQRRNIPVQEITTNDFLLPHLSARLQAFAEELKNGRGFGVIRGIPVENYTEEACKIISWGLCSYLGTGVPQSRQGEWINHVIDLSDVTNTNKPDFVRALSRTELRSNYEGGELRWHTDSTELIALFCLKKAKSGGESRLASSAKLHNMMLEKNPACLKALYDGYYYMSLPYDDKTKTLKLSSDRIPVFRRRGKSVSCYYIPQVVERAIDRANIFYTAIENDARELIQSKANTPGIAHEFMLEPGDLEVINNLIVMHARKKYKDHSKVDKRRHLLRLWMATKRKTIGDTPNTLPNLYLTSEQFRLRLKQEEIL